MAPTPPPRVSTPTYRIVAFKIIELPQGQRPYDGIAPPDLTSIPSVADANGVPMRAVGAGRVYAPVTVAQWGLANVAGYVQTGNPEYLRRAHLAADALVSIGVWSGSALYLPYRFRFALHGLSSDVLPSPWYSAMAEGQALSLFVRLYRLDWHAADLSTARSLYLAIQHRGRGRAPWVSYVDGSRYLWLEEYAEQRAEHTLNGMLFAIFGLYDYYTLTHDRNALNLLRGSLTTIRYNAIRYRNPRAASSYCLKHRTRSLKYHHTVVGQLQALSQMTGASYFASLAALLRRDAW